MAVGSILLGENPAEYDPANPIVLFIIQAAIVIIFCRLLHFPLAYIRQQVIGGILLGPTAFGRIPNFSATIFPKAASPNFNLVANLGLVLFLFIVGLEVDLRIVRKNARVAITVGAASLAIPFGIGCIIAYALYHEYRSTLSKGDFGIFLLFIGTAFSITAFPVLARILTELKLLRTNVGVTVISAGVGNDVVGWILLALTIALVNASSGLTAFYVILLVIAWTLLLFYAVKPAYRWCVKKSSMSSAPSNSMMTLTLLLVLVSAFYTQVIGVHAIFGAFLVGIIIPHEDGYAVSLAEKIEDLVSVLFLPLYFAMSGLNTNIGLLNDGKAWGFTILVIIAAFLSKFIGSMLAARLNGFLWRESGAVGVLMSCKGLVELIVLNIGLSAGILTQKLFTMFVIMALVTTFCTTPLSVWLYPEAFQIKVARWRAGEIDWDGNVLEVEHEEVHEGISKMSIVIHRVEGLAPLLQFVHFLPANRMHLIRTVELTDRLSQLIMVSETSDLVQSDSLISIFRTYSRLIGAKLSYAFETLDPYEFPTFISQEFEQSQSDLVVIPWIQDLVGGMAGNEYISALLESRTTNLAVIVDVSAPITQHLTRRTISMNTIPLTPVKHERISTATTKPEVEKSHMYFPVFAFGPDEILAMNLLEQFAHNDRVSIQVVYFKHEELPDTRTQEKGALEYTASVSDTESELQKLQAKVHGNMHLDVVECSDSLEQALSRQQIESRRGTLTTILVSSTPPSLSSQIKRVDRATLSASYGTFNRGETVEVFAGQREHVGRLCIVSAKA